MVVVRSNPHELIQASMTGVKEDERLGILLGGLIRTAAELTIEGADKKQAVRLGLKEALFHGVADPDDMRDWLRKINPWEGIGGWTADKLIRLMPVESMVDALLDTVIETTYQSMRRAGLVSHRR